MERISDATDRDHDATTPAAGSTVGPGFRRSTAATRPAPAYRATTVPAAAPDRRCRPADRRSARRALERQYATIEITDSVAMMGGHQVALARGYHGHFSTRSRRSKATC